jgi:translocation and assembly module TamB
VAFSHYTVQIQQFDIEGPGTSIKALGTADLKNDRAPLNVNLTANANLSTLQDVDRDFYSSGSLAMNARVHGSFSQPLVNGRIELKNANLNYSDAPNGLSNGNGVILLNGTSASIQSLTGESGGGKIAATGFVGFTGAAITYNLRATAKSVRTRYSGVSATSSATIRLTGNTNRSLLSGNVTVERIAYGSNADTGSLLSSASTPPTTPTAPSGVLAGMRLDIRILTDPDLRVITTYANRLAILANLTVRGTAADPGIIGQVTVTDGQLVFFGNEYTVNTGTINFYNPNAIEPVLNISLETIAQNVDVTIGVSGPMNDLKLTYRSDPPLTFQQIIALLATNTTPSDPTIAAQQPTPPQQSLSQMGESAVLGQAVANPLASRVQRVFGLTQFKVDPSLSGTNGQPGARVTLQQKIANNITFTYITDVTQTNSEIVRVEWAFTPKLSAVALRDFNGNVSLEFYYKFKVR